MKDRYHEGLAHGWEDCKEAVRETLARRDVSDRRKLELIAQQVAPSSADAGSTSHCETKVAG